MAAAVARGASCIVTGGSRGVGLAIAARLCASPLVSRVAVLSRSESAAEAGAAEAAARARAGPAQRSAECRGFACDVADPAQVAAALARAREWSGGTPATVVVNAAGITSDGLLVRASDEALRSTLATNLLGPMLVCREAAKALLRARQPAAILNIGSVVGACGASGQVAYSASKAGLIGLTKSLARELASRGVRVNMIEPGYVRTDMTAMLDHAALAKIVPIGRIGEPDEVAALAEFLLLDPKAGYITGSVLRVDGGLV